MSTTHQEIWESYVASWKAVSRQEKFALYKKCLNKDCVYTDPLTQTQGWNALADYMLDFHQQIPGGHFVTTWFLAHHGCSIAKWEMRGDDGQKIGDGISYATYSDEPALLSMTGFFETP